MQLRLILLMVCLPCVAQATEDRYGAMRPAGVIQGVRMDAAAGYGAQTRLTWPGQTPGAAPGALAPIPHDLTPERPPVPALPAGLPSAARSVPAAQAAPPWTPPAATPVVSSVAPLPIASLAPPAPVPPPVPLPPAAAPAASLAPTAAYGQSYAGGAARSYSVAREFGGTPDRILAPLPQSAYRGRAEVALSPEILGGSPAPESEPAGAETDEEPGPVRPVPKDKR